MERRSSRKNQNNIQNEVEQLQVKTKKSINIYVEEYLGEPVTKSPDPKSRGSENKSEFSV